MTTGKSPGGRPGGNCAQPARHDIDEIEEFPLLLRSGDVTALIAAARQQRISAVGLVRRLIGDYLRQTRSTRA
jgi:hypothetical protein